MSKQPNFLIIGAAKSGTTTLYQHLRAHPDVFLPDVKEPHYFVSDKALNFDVVSEKGAYRSLFQEAVQPLIGEASTGYLYFPGTAQKIHQVLPNCKIIALLRNPTARAFSMWGHQVREGLESMTFEDAVQQEIEGYSRAYQGTEFGFNYCKLGLVSDLLKEYQHQFGCENVFIGDYELLRTAPLVLMNQIYRFLGLASVPLSISNKRFNASGRPKLPWLHAFLNSQSLVRKAMVMPIKAILGKRLRHSAWQAIRNRNITSGTRHTIPAICKTQLDDYFKTEWESSLRLMSKQEV